MGNFGGTFSGLFDGKFDGKKVFLPFPSLTSRKKLPTIEFVKCRR